MKESQWVIHISGQGGKWEVSHSLFNDEQSLEWKVCAKKGGDYHYLPRSEYRLCDPPEVWVDVTKECEMLKDNGYPEIWHKASSGFTNVSFAIKHGKAYRLSKVTVPNHGSGMSAYFIVERKQ